MPTDRPIVVPPMRGDAAYDRYLDKLLAEAKKRGVQVETRSGLVEHALNVLGFGWGLSAPARVKPHGTNRYGPPKAKRDG